jgi:hypothetical protein
VTRAPIAGSSGAAEIMHVKWSDYLSTAIVRAISGSIIGALVSVPLIFFGRARHVPHGQRVSPLLDMIQNGHYLALILWFGAWAVGGALVAVLTIPRWQTPWYKGVLDDEGGKTAGRAPDQGTGSADDAAAGTASRPEPRAGSRKI